MFERTALPAGPRVISARIPGARSVSVAAYVLAGSRLESAEQVGVAHFMEHITFKGTAGYPTTRAISEARWPAVTSSRLTVTSMRCAISGAEGSCCADMRPR